MNATHIVAVDDSSESVRAYTYAAATLPQESKLLIIHGKPADYDLDTWSEGWIQQKPEDNSFDQVSSHFQRLCKQDRRKCEFSQVEYNTNKNLAQQICDISKARNALSVVVGSRPLSGQQKFFLGSVSRDVLSECGCPVTVVKTPQATNVESAVTRHPMPIL